MLGTPTARWMEKWAASGIRQIENYVNTQLSDVPRLRQKLQTPLNIAQNVHGAALTAVRGGQSALDQYQSIAQNVEQQLTVFRRESNKVVTQTTDEVKAKFEDASKRGAEAIHEQFQFSRALGSMFRGLADWLASRRYTQHQRRIVYPRGLRTAQGFRADCRTAHHRR